MEVIHHQILHKFIITIITTNKCLTNQAKCIPALLNVRSRDRKSSIDMIRARFSAYPLSFKT